VLELIRKTHPGARWLSDEGELPGYDIEYVLNGETYAIEVKGTTGRTFPSIEITNNEWGAARALRQRFSLYLVAECRSCSPKLQVIEDPAGWLDRGEASIEPLVLRFARRAAVGA
jgi:hypothetical protein